MAIVFRQVKGSPLTIEELDGNFEDLDDRVQVLEDVESSGGSRQIDFIEQVANNLIVHYTDATEDGPFPLGTLNLFFRGEWVISTSYQKYDIITAGGATYMVLFAHTSDPTSFDPGANDGMGNDYYGLLLANPSIALPTGGATDQVLTKVSGTNFDTFWASRGVPPDGFAGDVLTKNTEDEGDYEWAALTSLSAPLISASLTTLVLDDIGYAGKYVRCTHSSGCIITIPTDSELDFTIGTEIHFRQCSFGPLDFDVTSSDGSVALNNIDGCDLGTDTRGAVVTIKKVAVNTWDLFGLLRLESSSDTA